MVDLVLDEGLALAPGPGVVIAKAPAAQLLGLHPVAVQRDELIDRAADAVLDPRVSVAPERAVPGHHLAPLQRRHPAVRLVVEDLVDALTAGARLAVLAVAAVDDERERADRLGEDPNAGEDG